MWLECKLKLEAGVECKEDEVQKTVLIDVYLQIHYPFLAFPGTDVGRQYGVATVFLRSLKLTLEMNECLANIQ